VTDEHLLRDADTIRALTAKIQRAAESLPRILTLMEVCGTHTHAIAAAGLRGLLPAGVRLVSGPGCPVCVTPVGYLDRADALALLPDTTVFTFGDLYRVPSSHGSLERTAAAGGAVRIVYSCRDALDFARQNPDERIVFLAVGFETTTPTIAAALAEAEANGIDNFLILPGNKQIPPALRALAADPELQLDGLLLPGHVSVITGWRCYEFLAAEYGLAAVVTGFTPADMLRAILALVEAAARPGAEVVNHYGRVVSEHGNSVAQKLMERIFTPASAVWRGLGAIPGSGLALRAEWEHRNAASIEVKVCEPREPAGCRCGEVLRGKIDPPECPLFGNRCTPETPVGACMVSSEGSCAAWHRQGIRESRPSVRVPEEAR
jgi:hydrogenase expression/formation protein HypD